MLFLQKLFEPQTCNVFFLFLDSGRNWEISVQKFIKETRSLNENMNTCCRKKSQIPSVYNSLRTLLNWSKIKFKKLNWCRLTWLIDMFYLFSHSIRTFTFELVNNHCEFSFLYFIWKIGSLILFIITLYLCFDHGIIIFFSLMKPTLFDSK